MLCLHDIWSSHLHLAVILVHATSSSSPAGKSQVFVPHVPLNQSIKIFSATEQFFVMLLSLKNISFLHQKVQFSFPCAIDLQDRSYTRFSEIRTLMLMLWNIKVSQLYTYICGSEKFLETILRCWYWYSKVPWAPPLPPFQSRKTDGVHDESSMHTLCPPSSTSTILLFIFKQDT